MLTDNGDRIALRMHELSLSKSVLDTEAAAGVFPLDGAVDACDLARAAFQATGKFDDDLPLFVQRIKVCRTGIDAETLFTGVADFLVQRDMGFFVVFKGIDS